jgi:alcohol dehydrogenase class IV
MTLTDVKRERPALNTLLEVPGLPGKVEIKEAARVLGVSRVQVQNYIRAGYLDAIPVNNGLLLDRKQIENLYENPPKRGWVKGRPRKERTTTR